VNIVGFGLTSGKICLWRGGGGGGIFAKPWMKNHQTIFVMHFGLRKVGSETIENCQNCSGAMPFYR